MAIAIEMIGNMAKQRVILADLAKQVEEKQAEINGFEYVSTESDYDDYLDQEGDVTVAGLTFSPSQIIKELDPTAYRCGKIDYDDGMDLDDVEEYKDLCEELEGLEGEHEDAESALSEMVEEAEALIDAMYEEGANMAEIIALKNAIDG